MEVYYLFNMQVIDIGSYYKYSSFGVWYGQFLFKDIKSYPVILDYTNSGLCIMDGVRLFRTYIRENGEKAFRENFIFIGDDKVHKYKNIIIEKCINNSRIN